MSSLRTISFDAVIIGGGGSGMRAALQLSQSGHKTAVISRFFQRVHILFQLKVVLHVRLLAQIQMTIGGGTCTIP